MRLAHGVFHSGLLIKDSAGFSGCDRYAAVDLWAGGLPRILDRRPEGIRFSRVVGPAITI